MGPYEKRAPWTSSEITKLLNFVAKQTEKASSFLSFQQLCNGYLESNQSNQSLSALRSQIIKFLTVKIDDLVEFEINSKVMMLYKLQIAPIESFVIRLFQTAEVLLDDVNRISYYKENKVGGLVLGSLPPEARNSERVERRERSRTPSLPTSLPVPNSEVDPDEPIILTEYLERPNNNDNSDSRSVSCVHSSQESKGEIEYNLNSERKFSEIGGLIHDRATPEFWPALPDVIDLFEFLTLLRNMLMSLDSPMLDELLGDIYNKLAKQNQNIQTKDVALAFRTTLQVLAKNSSREENPLTSLSFTRVVTLLLNIVNHFYSQSLMEINMELRSTLAQYEDLCLRVPTETVICVMKMTINMCAQ